MALSDQNDAEASELHIVRSVVTIGLLTLIGALVPVSLASFSVDDRLLWGWSGGAFLALIWLALLHPTNRPVLVAMMRSDVKASLLFWFVLEPLIQVPLFFCVFGFLPQYAHAFYMLAVVINLIQCAQALLQVVYARVERKRR